MSEGQFGRYEILRRIGSGGMSTVYLARDPALRRSVAIKILPRELSRDPAFRDRFETEARAVALLNHQAIVPIYDIGEEDGQPYLVMRYMAGGSLGERMARREPEQLTTDEILAILEMVAPGLDSAHAEGIVHRDLKPANILFDEGDRAAIGDFGIAKIHQSDSFGTHVSTAAGTIVGTPTYMSPEQAMGGRVEKQSDIYALGVLLFHTLTGQPPFSGAGPIEVLMKHLNEPPPSVRGLRPDLPPTIDMVIARAMAKSPEQRFASATDLLHAFRASLDRTVDMTVLRLPEPEARREPPRLPAASPPPVAPSTMVFPVPRPATDPVPAPAPPEGVTLISLTGPQPSNLASASAPSIILRKGLGAVISPQNDALIQEWLQLHDSGQLRELLLTESQQRILLTGYGSFGGTSLMRGVAARMAGVSGPRPSFVLLRLDVGRGARVGQYDVLLDERRVATVSLPFDAQAFAQALWRTEGAALGPYFRAVVALMEDLMAALEHGRTRGSMAATLDGVVLGAAGAPKAILVIDRLDAAEAVERLAASGIFECGASFVVMARKEHAERWPPALRDSLLGLGFREWYVRRLWGRDLDMEGQLSQLLLDQAPEATRSVERERLETWLSHIAFKARGSLAIALRELKDQRGWKKDAHDQMLNIAGKYLSNREEIEHNSHAHRLVERNQGRILESLFNEASRTDRALIGIYYLMEWIRDNPIFSRRELEEVAAAQPITISARPVLVSEVLGNLLDVLEDEGYLVSRPGEGTYKVQWRQKAAARPAPAPPAGPAPPAEEATQPMQPAPAGPLRVAIVGRPEPFTLADQLATQLALEALEHGYRVVISEPPGREPRLRRKIEDYLQALSGAAGGPESPLTVITESTDGSAHVDEILAASDVVLAVSGRVSTDATLTLQDLWLAARQRGVAVVPVGAAGSEPAEAWRWLKATGDDRLATLLRAGTLERIGAGKSQAPAIARALIEGFTPAADRTR